MLVTTCPECDTTFRITEEILEKASGQVRCGRCAHVFDGNSALREHAEPESAGKAATPGIGSGDEPEPEQGAGAAEDDVSISGWFLTETTEEADGATAESALPADTADDADGERAVSGEAAAGSLTGDDVSLADSASGFASGNAAESADAADAASAADELDGLFDDDTQDDTVTGLPVTDGDFTSGLDEPLRRAWPWTAGVALLGLLLAGQLVHQLRSALAAAPGLGPALQLAYDAVGIGIPPRVDLGQYDLLALSAVAEPVGDEPGWLVIETRVRNNGPRVQPFPYIFLRLVDRWEETIAGRYFAPREYAVGAVEDFGRMNIGRTVDAQFIIVDPGPSATGFKLEFCTPKDDTFLCEADTQID